MSQCQCLLSSGVNVGTQCLNKAKYPPNDPHFCGVHKTCQKPVSQPSHEDRQKADTSVPIIKHIRFIDDRQDLLQAMKIRQKGLEPYMLDRLDMFWIEVTYKNREGTYAAEPSEDGNIILSRQSGSMGDSEIVLEHFKKTPEYHQMIQWYQNLVDGGYFEDGRFPGKNTRECPICNQQFKRGTTHEHLRLDGRNIVHHGRTYEQIIKAGLTPSWRSGYSAEEPSLEDQGLVKKIII